MLKGLIQNLKETDRWQLLVNFFKNKRNESLETLMNKAPNIEQWDIDRTNFEIEMFERLMNLDKWIEKEG